MLWIMLSTWGLRPILLGVLQREKNSGLSGRGLQPEIGEYSNTQPVIREQRNTELMRERASASE